MFYHSDRFPSSFSVLLSLYGLFYIDSTQFTDLARSSLRTQPEIPHSLDSSSSQTNDPSIRVAPPLPPRTPNRAGISLDVSSSPQLNAQHHQQQRYVPSPLSPSIGSNPSLNKPVTSRPNQMPAPSSPLTVAAPPAPPQLSPYEAATRRIEQLLLSPEIQIIPKKEFQQLIMHYGVPDKRQLRSLTWKLMLNYLPFDKSLWKSTLEKNRQNYSVLMKELMVNPFESLEKSFNDNKSQGNKGNNKSEVS